MFIEKSKEWVRESLLRVNERDENKRPGRKYIRKESKMFQLKNIRCKDRNTWYCCRYDSTTAQSLLNAAGLFLIHLFSYPFSVFPVIIRCVCVCESPHPVVRYSLLLFSWAFLLPAAFAAQNIILNWYGKYLVKYAWTGMCIKVFLC